MGQVSSQSRYRPDIDGLRAMAVLGVVLYHAGLRTLPGGFTGVDVFFVISGYLIGGHIYAELQSGSFSFLTFYYRRAKRILPASFLVVGVCLGLGATFLSPLELRHFGAEAAATNLFASNLYFFHTTGYFAPDSATRPLLMTWSLGIEEQFYFVVPVLLLLLFRWQRQRVLLWLSALFVLSLVYACVQVRVRPSAAFYLLPSRAWELGAGVLLALGAPRAGSAARQVCGWSGAVLLLGSLFLLRDALPFPGLAAIPSVLGTVLLIAGEASWVNRQVLSQPVLNAIGRRSYSWYLWHWPLLALARTIYGEALPIATALLLVAVAFVLADVTFRFVEQPFRSTRLLPRPLLFRYAAIIAVFVLVGGATFASGGWKQRMPALARQESLIQGSGSGEDLCLVTDGASSPATGAACDESGPRPGKVALWGDSHAGAIAGALRDRAHAAGFNFLEATKTACPPLLGVERWYPKNQAHAGECQRFDGNVLRTILADPNIRTVVLAAYWPDPFHGPVIDGWLAPVGQAHHEQPSEAQSDALLRHGLTATIDALERGGRQVIVMEDVPSFRMEPIWRLRTEASSVRRGLVAHWEPGLPIDPGVDRPAYPREDAHVNQVLEQITQARSPAATFDLAGALCSSPLTCRYRAGGEILYRDRQHLAETGAALALQAFAFRPGVTARQGNPGSAATATVRKAQHKGGRNG